MANRPCRTAERLCTTVRMASRLPHRPNRTSNSPLAQTVRPPYHPCRPERAAGPVSMKVQSSLPPKTIECRGTTARPLCRTRCSNSNNTRYLHSHNPRPPNLPMLHRHTKLLRLWGRIRPRHLLPYLLPTRDARLASLPSTNRHTTVHPQQYSTHSGGNSSSNRHHHHHTWYHPSPSRNRLRPQTSWTNL